MSKVPDWTYMVNPIEPAKEDTLREPLNWTRTAAAWIAGEDQLSHPPDWVLEMAYEQASCKNPAGNRDAALALLNMLAACLLEKGEFKLTPKAREILASMLTAILDGTDPAKAMFLEAKSGHTLWLNRHRNNGIVISMMVRINAGMRPGEAAKEVAQNEEYRGTKTGKPLSAKTINNIWCDYKKNPWPRASFAAQKTPE